MKSLVVLVLAAVTAQAAPSHKEVFKDVTFSAPKCYGHAYTAQELTAKPQQTVSAMKATLMKYSDDPTLESAGLKIELKLKNEKPAYKAEFSCFDNAGHTLCAIECDGGSVIVEAKTDASLTLKSNGFMIHGGCDDQTEEIVKRLVAKPGQDDIFTLEAKACAN